jgi:eukaryotic translation initiation factor 2C
MFIHECDQVFLNLQLQLGNGAIVPIELCTVAPGQIIRKQIPPEKTKDVLDFSTKKPLDRFNSIRNGLSVSAAATLYRLYTRAYGSYQVLQYGQSDYVRSFGMVVEQEPLSINARVLAPPTLVYGLDDQKRRQTIVRHIV